MQIKIAATVLLVMIAGSALATGVSVDPVTSKDADEWLCYTVPLPKQISITAQALVSKGSVELVLAGANDHAVYGQICEEFAEVCGVNRPGTADVPFRIRIQVGGPEAEPLKKLKNGSQAYSISSESGKSVTIVSMDQRGAYYGWKTLSQLIRGRSSGDSLRIPVLSVTDWPDMEKRGLWGTDNYDHLAWLGERKMNHMEQINARGVDEEGNFYAHTRDFNKLLDTHSERYAIDYVPVILHLEQVWQDTMARFYPQMRARNATHGGTLCYAEPKTVEMISEWIYLLAVQSSTDEVDVWMTENLAGRTGCQCDECRKAPYTINEARAIIKAWKMAEKKLGRPIIIYLLTSEETENDNARMMAELPKEVRIWYYHSLLTYITTRQPMLRPYLGEFVKNGGWLGVCPSIDAWVHNNLPFTGAAFINYRMDEFVTKGLKGLLGYATPRVHYHKFNVEAAAEWTWNLKGRSTRQFAYSYAVRRGYQDPSLFAQWSETMGPVAWDVHGSNWPGGHRRIVGVKVDRALREGTLPELGVVLWDAWPIPWGNIKSERQFERDVAAARKAVRLAREMGIPQYLHESLVVDGYIRTMKALYEMKKLAPNGVMFTPSNQYKASQQLREFLRAAEQVKENLPKWEDCVARESERAFNFTGRPVDVMTEVADAVKKVAVEMGAKAN